MANAQRWVLRRHFDKAFQQVANELGLHPLLARVLYGRKIDSVEQIRAFLSTEGTLADPFRMAGMQVAVSRLGRAIKDGEAIVVYGDYDADGVSATVLLVSALRALGGRVEHYIPNRFDEAYGLNDPALEHLAGRGARLVVTVDCGVRSVHEVAHGNALGLDMIVTDHHSLPAELPPALAVLNPKRPDCDYPYKELSGVGVAYRLAEALFQAIPSRAPGAACGHEQFLDLVALGTVADIVPLLGENRLLAQHGLGCLRGNQDTLARPGLAALMRVADVAPGQADSQCIGFRLGPRLNAAGRLESADLAYKLLMTQSLLEATQLADELDALNRERQRLLEEQVALAQATLGDEEPDLAFVAGPDFHEGIVGLIASRLTEDHYRPSLVMRTGADGARGSARSIEGFHVTHALDACADLLTRYGGHARAAGFSLPTENVPAFRERLQAYAAKHLPAGMLGRRYDVDAIVSLDDIDERTPEALAAMEPFGEGNPEPALASLGVRLQMLRPVGQDGRHLRLTVSNGRRSIPVIAFRYGHLAKELTPGDLIDLIYRPTMNEWQGQCSLQLVASAIRKSESAQRNGETD
ncbi:MAG: single-stranded-DNA-specific exonuclease RecJ [Anaerolineae bacterium]